MIGFLRAMITRGQASDLTLNQKGGGRYTHVDVRNADETGISAIIDGKVHFIPWTSINEVREA